MATNEYKLKTYKRDARPRSERLRKLGGGTGGSTGGSTVINVNGSGNAESATNHTHANKNALDQISTDTDGYLYLTQDKEVQDENGDYKIERVTEKVKAGYADVANDLTEDSPVRKQFLSRVADDTAEGNITFNQEITVGGLSKLKNGTHIFEFTQGMIGGSGAAFYKNEAGRVYVEADGAYLRDELVTPKITFNCIDVISGDKANTFAFGTIKSVDTENNTAELDLLEDQRGTLHVNDICRGIFHNIEGDNLQDDMQDDNGFYGYAGFSTAYFTPVEILANEPGTMRFRYELQPGTTVHPMKGMNFFAYGNFTDTSRQAITYETRYYARRLKNVNTWVIDPTKNISMQDGLLEGLVIGGMVMHGYGTFQENCYFTGVNIQFTPETENALKGESAYSVSLSTYERTVKADINGDISNLSFTRNVVTGDLNVVTGDKNVVTSDFLVSTYIQAFKGSTQLLYSATPSQGKYSVVLSPQGCTAAMDAGKVVINGITDYDECYVDIQVNCEGSAVFEKRFSITVVRDGETGYSNVSADLDNEMASLACDSDGNVTAGLPAETTVSMYYGTELLPLDSLEAESPAGVALTADKETRKVSVTAVEAFTPDTVSIPITCLATYNGQSIERTVYMKLTKVRPGTKGENAVLYSLVVEPSAVTLADNGRFSADIITCKIVKTDGDMTTELESIPQGLSLYYDFGNGLTMQGRYPYKVYTSEFSSQTKGCAFYLRRLQNDLDIETVPVIKDGNSPVMLDFDNEVVSVACDAEGNVISGLPAKVKCTMYNGSEEMAVYFVNNGEDFKITIPDGVTINKTFNYYNVELEITKIAKSVKESEEVTIMMKGWDGYRTSTICERTSKIRLIKVLNAPVIYQLNPSIDVVRVNSSGVYEDILINTGVTKNDGKVTSLSELPSGYRLTIQYDDGEEKNIEIGQQSLTIATKRIIFRLYNNEGDLIDQETVPIVRDGLDGDAQQGPQGPPGEDGKQGIQGCVTRVSIWAQGREYRNDSDLTGTSTIRYIDIAMVQDTTVSTGWRAYRCKRTHTSSASITYSNTTYWEQFAQNVTALYTDLIIAKNAQLFFMQGNQLLIMDDSNGITAGMSGSTSGQQIRIWAGAQQPEDAPFRVNYRGKMWATDGIFSGDITANTLTLKKNTAAEGEIINGSFLGMQDYNPRFPKLSGNEVRQVIFSFPIISRVSHPMTFAGEDNSVYFRHAEKFFDSKNSIYFPYVDGVSLLMLGYVENNTTTWLLVPLTDTAKKVLDEIFNT